MREPSAAAPAIVLASSSPRRSQLLAQLGISFSVVAPDIDETPYLDERPDRYVRRLAVAKAWAIAIDSSVANDRATLMIAADTTVDVDGQVFGKPADAIEAQVMLGILSGRTHQVHTGVAVRMGDQVLSDVSTSDVTFATLSSADIAWYIATNEPFDKAGAYAIQGAGGVFVEHISGSVSGIIGLPLDITVALARQLGVELR